MHAHLAIALVVASACHKTEPPPPPAPAAPIPRDAAPVARDAAPAATIDARKPPPADLPAFAPSKGPHEKADELVHHAWRAKDGFGDGADDPLDLAVSAVRSDPGSAFARMAVACTAGDDAFALAQLAPLARGCDECTDVLRDVAMPNNHDCAWSPAVKDLAAHTAPTPQRLAAEAVMASLGDGDGKRLERFFSGARVELVRECSLCDSHGQDHHETSTGKALLAKLMDQVIKAKANGTSGEWVMEIVVGEGLRCANDCCAVDRGMLAHERDFFAEVCFEHGTDRVRKLVLIAG